MSLAQDEKSSLILGLYADLFYGYDFNQPKTVQRLPYLYHYNRHASVGLNHGILSAQFTKDKLRSNIAFHAGTYVQDNYSNEPDPLKSVFNANVGVALNSRKNIWLDVGIFGDSYIGFEGTRSYGNVNAGHNLISENVPYFMTGIKATYEPNDNWVASVLLLNGWQRIQMVEGGSLPSFGTQLKYKKNQYVLNWSSFIGTDDPDISRRMRYYNSFYGLFNLDVHWTIQVGFDVGFQNVSKGSTSVHTWTGTAAVLQYRMNEKLHLGGRAEYYWDPNEVIVSTNQGGYKTSGFSLNADYLVMKDLKWRVEGRLFASGDDIYPLRNGGSSDHNFFLVTVLTFDLTSSPIKF
jgi:hypothetical protein